MVPHEFDDMFIKRDIEKYNQRIATAKEKVSELPATAPTWFARKKLTVKRRYYQDEIRHIEHLIEIASDALEEPHGR